jgi:glutamyl-tRNA reductase
MIAVVGLSHRTAPIAVREKLAIPSEDVPAVLAQLLACPAIAEAMLISTCNRVEVVVAARAGKKADLRAVAEQAKGVLLTRAPNAGAHLYAHAGQDAVKHVFRVAASLDSLVVGESQILGQVKEAFEIARKAGTVGPALNRGVARAIHTAKLVRTQTAIGTGQVSVPTVAVDLAAQIFGDLRGHTVVLVGAGEMAENVARLLRGAGAALFVVGRTFERARELAERVDAEPRAWSELAATLVKADVVITSTSAPTHVISYEDVAKLRRSRRGRSLFFIDLAVPRDVEPRVDSLDGTFLYNIDDFSRIVAESLSSRQKEAARAEELVLHEVEGYGRWAESELATPTIVALRRRFGGTLQAELDRSLKGKLKHLGEDDRAALNKMMEAALNKMLHLPTVRLRELATNLGEGYANEELLTALRELFALDSVELGSQSESDVPSDASAAEPFAAPAHYPSEPSEPSRTGEQH